MSDDVPMIWTVRGNLPVESLQYATRWDVAEHYVKLVETYTDADGVVVRESAHVLTRHGLTADPQAARI